jgi:hypothetical protein
MWGHMGLGMMTKCSAVGAGFLHSISTDLRRGRTVPVNLRLLIISRRRENGEMRRAPDYSGSVTALRDCRL